jgi:ribosomal protein S18 acetylase RimI-like enzyme
MDLTLNVIAGDGPNVRGSILRSNQALTELVSEKTTLDHGIAFCAPQFASVAQCNQFREVWVESPEEAELALVQAEEHFALSDAPCNRWALAEGQKPEVIEPVLLNAGFTRKDKVAMALECWPAPSEAESQFRILPARAMRAAFAEVCSQHANLRDGEPEVEVESERLDDHRLDAFVAMDGKRPIGLCSLFHVGDIGRIVDLFVIESARRRHVGTAMARHIIALAHRYVVRVVCIELDETRSGSIDFLKRNGFIEAGRLIEYVRPAK